MIFAGTGHRPRDTSWKYNESHINCIKLKQKIKVFLLEYKDKIDYVISGGAMGFDTWLAEACYELQIPYHVYVPFKGQENKWFEKTKQRYKKILRQADNILLVSEGGYDIKKLFKRNEKMVDSCDEVIAYWNPERQQGGTFATIRYAQKVGKPIHNLYLDGDSDEIPF